MSVCYACWNDAAIEARLRGGWVSDIYDRWLPHCRHEVPSVEAGAGDK